MFLPMSWTSPFTVAITMRAADDCSVFSASMYGSRYATARFIARALFTTCGRNIFPEPNRSPTIFIPSMSGPSMTSSGRATCSRASSVSSSMKSTTPCTSACASRSATGASRHEIEPALRRAAGDGRGVLDEPLGRVGAAVEEDVLDALEQVGLDVLVDGELAGVDDSQVEPPLDRRGTRRASPRGRRRSRETRTRGSRSCPRRARRGSASSAAESSR